MAQVCMENTSSSFLNTNFGTQRGSNGCRTDWEHRVIRRAPSLAVQKKPPHTSRINICVPMIFPPLQLTSCILYQFPMHLMKDLPRSWQELKLDIFVFKLQKYFPNISYFSTGNPFKNILQWAVKKLNQHTSHLGFLLVINKPTEYLAGWQLLSFLEKC